MNKKRILTELHPTKLLVYGFLLLIFIGSILLTLPISTVDFKGATPINAIFTATSAVCVTGLAVYETAAHWSLFGKVVILILIQMGGLGIMTTVTMGIFVTGKRVSLHNRMVLRESLNETGISGVVKITKRIIIFTFLIELIGAIMLSFTFIPRYGSLKGVAYSVFHSVSAFCNAGFDIVGPNSIEPYAFNIGITFPIMFLIVSGGLGFHVLTAMVRKIKGIKTPIHAKFVIILTFILIITGFLLFFGFEYNNAWKDHTIIEKAQLSIFQSVTTRTAGFATYNQSNLSSSSKVISKILMFIGGSPGSTAGGVKTTTIGVIIITVISIILGKKDNEIFHKRIQFDLIRRAITVVFISFTLILLCLVILTITEPSLALGDIFFETISAFGTVGLSTGITASLSTIGKTVIIVLMFFGRVGPVTILVAIWADSEDKNIIRYPQGRIYIG